VAAQKILHLEYLVRGGREQPENTRGASLQIAYIVRNHLEWGGLRPVSLSKSIEESADQKEAG